MMPVHDCKRLYEFIQGKEKAVALALIMQGNCHWDGKHSIVTAAILFTEKYHAAVFRFVHFCVPQKICLFKKVKYASLFTKLKKCAILCNR